jgi:hypothetical protein
MVSKQSPYNGLILNFTKTNINFVICEKLKIKRLKLKVW